MTRIVLCSALLLGYGCDESGGDGTGMSAGMQESTASQDETGSDGEDSPENALTHDADMQPIWDANCVAKCHEPSGEWFLVDLSEGEAYTQLVDKPSTQASPPMVVVAPGELENSYLWYKLNNTHLNMPKPNGIGEAMPKGKLPLDNATLDQIKAWIEGGAAR